MADFEIAVDVDAPAPRALELVGDFDIISDFHPQVASCTVEGDGEGSVRTCTLSDGSVIVERLESDTDDGYAYVMLQGPSALLRYEGRVRVAPHGEGCTITWSVDFTVRDGRDEAALVERLRGLVETGLESAKRFLEG